MEAVDTAEDSISLAQRARARLLDARLAEVVAHALESLGGCGHAPNRHRERGHEVHQPAEEGPVLQEVVVTLDESGGGRATTARTDHFSPAKGRPQQERAARH